jgi:hypothetical protein
MGGRGFIGLEWMPNTHNQLKKKDKHKYTQNVFQNLKITKFLVYPIPSGTGKNKVTLPDSGILVGMINHVTRTALNGLYGLITLFLLFGNELGH